MSGVSKIEREARCSHLVDRLGELQAQLTDLRQQESAIKEEILRSRSSGPAVRGVLWECELVTIGPSSKTEWKSVALALRPPKSLIDRYTKQIAPYVQFRMYPVED